MKKINTVKFFFFFLLLLTSCNEAEKKTTLSLLKNTQNEIFLQGIVLHLDSFVVPGDLSLIGNNIIVKCNECDTVFVVYEIENNKLKHKKGFGRIGQGPCELIDYKHSYDFEKQDLYLYDNNSSAIKMFKINISEFENIYDYTNWKQIQMPESRQNLYTKFVSYDSTSLIGLGGDVFGSNLLTYINYEKNEISALEIEYPNDGLKIPDRIKNTAYRRGNILKKPKDQKYLYYNFMGQYAEIITISDINNSKRKVIVNNPPIYKAISDNMNCTYDENCFMGVKAYITDQLIYVMPEPYRKKEYLEYTNYKGYPRSYADELYIFDWAGNFLRYVRLDQPIDSFVVDEKDIFLYATSIDLEGDFDIIIKKYDLSAINNGGI